MAFTDAEMAILSQLAYYGSDVETQTQPARGKGLHSVLTNPQIKEYLENSLGADYKTALNGLIEKTKDRDYKIIKAEDDNKGTGFAAIAILDPNNEVTVAARGTEGFDVFTSDASRRDVAADLQLAYSVSTLQQQEIEKFMKSLEIEGYDGYYFTGHSLGGNLANYAAITFKPIEKVKGVVTFNAPGFNEGFVMKCAAEINIIYNRLKNYQNEYDYVSSIMYVPGDKIIISSSKKEKGWFDFDDHLGFDDHSLKTLTIVGDAFERKELQDKSVQTEVARILIDAARMGTGTITVAVTTGAIELAVNLGRYVAKGLSAIGEWLNKTSSNKQSTTANNPTIKVDTAKLRGYASRLKSVNTRLSNLDKRLDSLYLKVGLRDLLKLLQADLMTGSSSRISNCEKYLNETASDFDTAERNAVGQF